MIAGATLIALFPAENDDSGDVADTSQILTILSYSMVATLCLSTEILTSKSLSKKGVDGKYLGFSYLLIEGGLGTFALIISTAIGEGLFTVDMGDFWITMLAGLCGVTAISLLEFSVSIGIAGIVISIFNTNVAFFTALCFFFLD